MEQKCLGAIGKGDCNKRGKHQRGLRDSGNEKGQRRQCWDMELEGLMELEMSWVKGIWMRERALSVISWDCLFLTPVSGNASPSHIAISQADCYLQLAAPPALPPAHDPSLLNTEERGRNDFKRVTFCFNKNSELASIRSELSYLKADDKYVLKLYLTNVSWSVYFRKVFREPEMMAAYRHELKKPPHPKH